MKNREIVYISLFTAVALVLYIFETVLPKPFPWFRFGLANVVTLIVLLNYNWKYVLWIVVFRVIIGSIFVGTIFTPAFVLSLCGSLSSLVVMAIMVRYFNDYFSIIGISILGAFTNNVVQLLVSIGLYVKSYKILYLAPIFGLISVVMGGIIGCIALLFHQKYSYLFKDTK